jgi:hypothetical protein
MSHRRLVPMPTKRAAPPPAPPAAIALATDRAPARLHWTDNLAAKIRATPPWLLFAWLAATAVVYAFFGRLILLIVGLVLLVRGWLWLSLRFPLTMMFVNSFIAALLRSGRRR